MKCRGIVAGAFEGDEVVYGDNFFERIAAPWDEKSWAVEEVGVKFFSERDEGGIFPNFAGGVVLVIGVDLDDSEVLAGGEIGGHVIFKENC